MKISWPLQPCQLVGIPVLMIVLSCDSRKPEPTPVETKSSEIRDVEETLMNSDDLAELKELLLLGERRDGSAELLEAARDYNKSARRGCTVSGIHHQPVQSGICVAFVDATCGGRGEDQTLFIRRFVKPGDGDAVYWKADPFTKDLLDMLGDELGENSEEWRGVPRNARGERRAEIRRMVVESLNGSCEVHGVQTQFMQRSAYLTFVDATCGGKRATGSLVVRRFVNDSPKQEYWRVDVLTKEMLAIRSHQRESKRLANLREKE